MTDLDAALRRWTDRMAQREDPESATHNVTLRAAMREADARLANEQAAERECERARLKWRPLKYRDSHWFGCRVWSHYAKGWITVVPAPPPCTCAEVEARGVELHQ